MHVSMHVCLYVCLSMSMCVCMYAYMCANMFMSRRARGEVVRASAASRRLCEYVHVCAFYVCKSVYACMTACMCTCPQQGQGGRLLPTRPIDESPTRSTQIRPKRRRRRARAAEQYTRHLACLSGGFGGAKAAARGSPCAGGAAP